MPAGRYVVTHAEEAAATLRAASSGRIFPVVDPPDLAAGEALAATLEPADALEATWTIATVERRWTVSIAASDRPPGERALAAAPAPGEIERLAVESGACHVIGVPEETTEFAVEEVIDDPATRDRAVRLGVDRVAVRSAPGVVVVRYEDV
ncbi:MAG: DUF5812 family protein [Halococcoides sp.]